MQSTQQLSSFSAAEDLGRPPMERSAPSSHAQEEERIGGCVNTRPMRNADSNRKKPSPPSSPRSPKVDKRTRKGGPSPPYIHPLPTIETIMTYPSLTRTVYDSLVRGEPPARTYNTVIHTPKPMNMRTLDDNLLRSAELSAWRRRNRSRSNASARSRSSTVSSTASTATDYSTNSSSAGADSDSSASDVSESGSPISVSSTSKATIASSTATTPRFPLNLVLEIDQPMLSTAEDRRIEPPSREPSPAQSFYSTHSTRSSAPSPASSAYPSPPASPELSRRSSSSGEEYMAYPSPPPSPRPMQQQLHRERRSFSFPPPSQSSSPPPLTRSSSLQSHPWSEGDALEFDLGAQKISLEPLDEAEDESDEDMDWSMNGGTIVIGAAGVAMSPRAMHGTCCSCEHEHTGLGLYVIDEEEEAAAASSQ
ncbi:hypothetical protein BDV96DRAFT_341534 [Lophiotrema nucula]|uniref:Uncharacterized protein n=1 Tax=Lophiotrema nucula TaxID=690887 RepID=A0A6A5ZI29_9PLEO|nr:hypothetical protein BDV96DRAFT_341534 [Lophiotrema nucula]